MIKTDKQETTQQHNYFEVAPGVWGMKDIFVNFYMIRDGASGNWVLVDSGLKSSKSKILQMAKDLFGDRKPKAIILTHGHFDHTGSVESLAHEWKTQVYAHYLEFPYLSGLSAYPPPDPGVGGGLMSTISQFYRKEPIDISNMLVALPDNEDVPFLSEWKYIHTPGHSPGHISLFRESDKILIAGDAFVTTRPESLFATITQKLRVSGPPMYFTCDWESAELSVRRLAELNPLTAATGHGKPFSGQQMTDQLQKLADNFRTEAIPEKGRYVDEPAISDASGILYVPPKLSDSNRKWLIAGAIILTGLITMTIVRTVKSSSKN
ncbi:MAG: MBL fold metallo-hydrolase [Chitinophagaceae bacterium]|nr:MAG: MBL fold metallo-hydrolase [Chitinophagaceae bacterium]